MKRLLVSGSNGLIGSEMVSHFHGLGWDVPGVDNNMRADFFGPTGDTRWNQKRCWISSRASRITKRIEIATMQTDSIFWLGKFAGGANTSCERRKR